MSTKHTAGPWTLNKGNKKPMVGLDIGDNLGLLPIAPEVHGYSIKEAKANARLIAAAPDMLAALRAFDAAYASIHDRNPDLPPDSEPMRMWSRARAAIAKATGERA